MNIAAMEVGGGSSPNKKKASDDAKRGSTKIRVESNVGETYLTA
jgi:hypothetical protein